MVDRPIATCDEYYVRNLPRARPYSERISPPLARRLFDEGATIVCTCGRRLTTFTDWQYHDADVAQYEALLENESSTLSMAHKVMGTCKRCGDPCPSSIDFCSGDCERAYGRTSFGILFVVMASCALLALLFALLGVPGR